ncbi:MAG: heavy-metal-associated domain-containing protein [Veillonellaceae bacterium]|jgi:copper chaperone|nr:heavy-metal-associated domain-containing protein [Veillonellaceae bacterium]
MKQTLIVEGMSCSHCKNAVETAVKSLPGVTFAEVDLVAKKLTVDFDETKTDIDQVRAAVEDAGFEVP